MNKDEALKLALDALEHHLPLIEDFGSTEELGRQHRAIGAVYTALAQSADYERGFVDDMQHQMKSSVDKAVNRMRQQMEIKGVVMRCVDYDIALPVIDIREGHVLVGQVTTPPQREWVGLTPKDVKECITGLPTQTIGEYARRVEAKLKEKNCG